LQRVKQERLHAVVDVVRVVVEDGGKIKSKCKKKTRMGLLAEVAVVTAEAAGYHPSFPSSY
jgi:hypothetical protein